MSGEKCSYVRVNQREYDRLRNQARRNDTLEENMRNEMNKRTKKMNQELNRRMSEMNRRFARQEKQIEGMSEEIRDFQLETNRRLKRQAEQFHKGFQSLQTEVTNQREEYISVIHKQNEQMEHELNQHKKETQAKLNEITENIAKKESDKERRALIWYEDTTRLLASIDEGTRHEKFKPGAFGKLQAELQLVKGNIKQGDYEASLSASQQCFIRANEFQTEIALLEMEWEAELQAAKQKIAELLSLCEAQQECSFSLETAEGTSIVDGQIDFWTEGAQTALESQALEEAKKLNTDDSLTLEELKESIKRSEEWYIQATEIAYQAQDCILASQVRVDMAERIAETLAESNWQVTDNTYEGEDERKAVHVKFENTQGDEIVTIITPEKRGEGIHNRLDISFFDRSHNDEQFRADRLQNIYSSLSSQGIEIGETTCTPGTENGPATDVAKLNFDLVREQKKTLRV